SNCTASLEKDLHTLRLRTTFGDQGWAPRMSHVSERLIESFLKQYGWSFHGTGQGRWVTGWQGEQQSFPLVIELTDTWLSLTVAPLMKLGVDWNNWPEVMRFLLELNYDCKFVKVGIDEFGDISLSMQIFVGGLNYDQFSDALGVVGHYAEKFF